MISDDFVCVENKNSLESMEYRVKIMKQRECVLESLSGIVMHEHIIQKCVLIQKFFRNKLFEIRTKNAFRVISLFHMHKGLYCWKSYYSAQKKLSSELFIKNSIITYCYRKRFLKKKNAANTIKYYFRLSLDNVTYSQTCKLVRELNYLKQRVDSKLFIINNLKRKLKQQQKQNTKQQNVWYGRNILI